MKSLPFMISALITCAASGAQAETPRAPQAGPAPVSGEQQSSVAYTHAGPQDEQPSRRWYGGQTLATDGAALGFVLLVAGAGATEVGVAGWLGTYLLGGPIVHAAHGRTGAAFGSLGIRIGAPLILGAVGVLGDNCGPEGCGGSAVATGLALGMLGAIVLDAAVLAYERVPPREISGVRLGAMRLNASLEHTRNESKLVLFGSF